MSLNHDTGYAIKRILQIQLNLEAGLRVVAKSLMDAADLLHAESLQLNADLELPDFQPPAPDPPPAAPGPPTSQISTRFGSPPPDVAAAIMSAWPLVLQVSAAEISFLESGWNPRAELDTTAQRGPCGTPYTLPDGRRAVSESSRGLFQVNRCAHGGGDELFDPAVNAAKAYEIYQRQGFAAWLFSAQKLGLI